MTFGDIVILSAAKNLSWAERGFFKASPGGRLKGMTGHEDQSFAKTLSLQALAVALTMCQKFQMLQ